MFLMAKKLKIPVRLETTICCLSQVLTLRDTTALTLRVIHKHNVEISVNNSHKHN